MKFMGGDLNPETALRVRSRICLMIASAFLFGLAGCNQAATTTNATAPAATEAEAEAEEGEFPEFAVAPAELANHKVDEIVNSLRLNATAVQLGKKVYAANCASCHAEELGGTREAHAPNLTDPDWLFSGDHLQTGGVVKLPSDVEWTVLYGIRTDHPQSRGLEADMVAYLPENRNAGDTKQYGNQRFLTDQEIDEVVEYVMQIGGQQVTAQQSTAIDYSSAQMFNVSGRLTALRRLRETMNAERRTEKAARRLSAFSFLRSAFPQRSAFCVLRFRHHYSPFTSVPL